MNNARPIGKYRRGTRFKVDYPTLPSIQVQPREITLTQKQKKHDVLVIEYQSTSLKNAKLLKTGVPIKFSWKQGSRKVEWLGYVSSVTRKGGAQKAKPMKVFCVGSSFVLKQRKTKTYKNRTIPEVAARIAKQNKLKFVGDTHSRRFPQLVISGQTQWKWLNEQAARIGFIVYVEGTTMYFRAIDKVIDKSSSNTPIFQLWDPTIPRSFNQLDRTLDSLEVMTGENIEDDSPSRTVKQVGGVNPVTGKSFTSKTSPKRTGKAIRKNVSSALFDEFNSEQVANTKGDAKDASKGAAELARFNLPAKAYGQGDPRVRPHQLIYVEGSGEQTDGHWVVRESTHKFVYGGSYSVEMLIATDGTEENAISSGVAGSNRSSSKSIAGVINLNQLISSNGAFSVNGDDLTINLAVEQGIGGTGSASITSGFSGTSRLAINSPILTQVNNQGFDRTPSIWQTTSPSSTSARGSIRKRRCSNG